jgi:hypothetical protein
MSWKVVAALILIGVAGYAVYRYLGAGQVQQDSCAKMLECAGELRFGDEYGSVEECAGSEAGARLVQRYLDCDVGLGCDEWMECGYGIGDPRFEERESSHKTNFQQIQDQL